MNLIMNKMNSIKTCLTGLAVISGVLLTGCTDKFTFTPAPTGNTIVGIAGTNDSLKAFVAAINIAGFSSNLDNVNGGQFTIFAPSNYAFVKYLRSQGVTIAKTSSATAGDMAVAAINALTVTSSPTISALAGRLSYHIVSSAIPSTAITAGETFNTINSTARLSLSVGTTSPFIINANNAASGANVTDSGTAASNGVIYQIDKVMSPISNANVWVGSLLNFSVNYTVSPITVSVGGVTLARDGSNNFNVSTAPTNANDNDNNLFSAAIARANLATLIFPNVTILPDYTVFTPNDGAFRAYLGVTTEAAGLTAINAMTPDAAAAIVNYHIVNGRLLSTDFSTGAAVNTWSTGNTFSINTTGFVVTDAKGNTATFTAKDNLSNAGVMHTINKVLQHN
jgi:uncharacterized surface protein with fasciclin (FAS1) repeats